MIESLSQVSQSRGGCGLGGGGIFQVPRLKEESDVSPLAPTGKEKAPLVVALPLPDVRGADAEPDTD
jgi:hypothetical protein